MASRDEDIGSSALEGGAIDTPVPLDRMFEAKPVWKRMVVILAGVTMNALFAWLVFSFLAFKNGHQIDPVTTVGRVMEELIPPGGEGLASIPVGTKIETIDGKPVDSWDDVQQGIANSPADEVRIGLSTGATVTLPIHPDAMEERLKASQAIQPFRPAVVGQVIPSRPADRAGVQAGDTIVAINGRPIDQWYDLLETLQTSTGAALTLELAHGDSPDGGGQAADGDDQGTGREEPAGGPDWCRGRPGLSIEPSRSRAARSLRVAGPRSRRLPRSSGRCGDSSPGGSRSGRWAGRS